MELLAVAAAAERAEEEAQAAEARAKPCCESKTAVSCLLLLAFVLVIMGVVMMAFGDGVMRIAASITIGAGVLILIVHLLAFGLCVCLRSDS